MKPRLIRFIGHILRFRLYELVRYPLGIISGVLLLSILFIGLFQSTLGITGGTGLGRDVALRLVQHYLLWSVIITGLSNVSSAIAEDTRTGSFEILLASGISVSLALAGMSLVQSFIMLMATLAVGLVVSVVYGVDGVFTGALFLALVTSAVAATGLGLMLGGLTLVFKEIGEMVSLLQFLMLPLFLALDGNPGPAYLIPGFSGLAWFAGPPGLSTALTAILPALFWFGAGMLVFRFATHRARHKATVYEF